MPGQGKELEAVDIALVEIAITTDVKESVRPDLLNTRESLIVALHKLGQSRDIDGILQAERGILEGERKYLAEEPEMMKSLDTAIEQIEAAIETLAIVRDPDQYRVIDENLSISKNRVGRERLPKDQARQFFQAHPTRLRNLIKGRIDESYVPVIRVRLLNTTMMEPVYKELQKRHLGPRDSSNCYSTRARTWACNPPAHQSSRNRSLLYACYKIGRDAYWKASATPTWRHPDPNPVATTACYK